MKKLALTTCAVAVLAGSAAAQFDVNIQIRNGDFFSPNDNSVKVIQLSDGSTAAEFAIGSFQNISGSLHEFNETVNLAAGDYQLQIFDAFGDGINDTSVLVDITNVTTSDDILSSAFSFGSFSSTVPATVDFTVIPAPGAAAFAILVGFGTARRR
ncbi:MAG: hypothetical protein AAGB34_07920 [Planctomycetota bacterium]